MPTLGCHLKLTLRYLITYTHANLNAHTPLLPLPHMYALTSKYLYNDSYTLSSHIFPNNYDLPHLKIQVFNFLQ